MHGQALLPGAGRHQVRPVLVERPVREEPGACAVQNPHRRRREAAVEKLQGYSPAGRGRFQAEELTDRADTLLLEQREAGKTPFSVGKNPCPLLNSSTCCRYGHCRSCSSSRTCCLMSVASGWGAGSAGSHVRKATPRSE